LQRPRCDRRVPYLAARQWLATFCGDVPVKRRFPLDPDPLDPGERLNQCRFRQSVAHIRKDRARPATFQCSPPQPPVAPLAMIGGLMPNNNGAWRVGHFWASPSENETPLSERGVVGLESYG